MFRTLFGAAPMPARSRIASTLASLGAPLLAGCVDEAAVKSSTDSALGPAANASQAASEAPAAPAGAARCDATNQVVSFETDDGVTLEADYLTPAQSSGAAVLLHMVPPSNDRSNYPPAFIERLLASGLQVLNVDRRGAGNSEGNAAEAYTGPNGKLDAKAAYDFLLTRPCAVAADRVTFVGASNGTTSVLDYLVFAANEAPQAKPRAAVFLTGGSYTESQNGLNAQGELVSSVPLLFVFSTAERAWSAGFQTNASELWQFQEYQPGGHGTQMFAANPESIDAVANFLEAQLQ
jgi:pimeloyl-ACP methyl ester carboxylesterase